jgi:hypothetical protein
VIEKITALLPPALSVFLEKVRGNGFTPVLVGGAVRDFYLGKTEIKDWDFEIHGLSSGWDNLLHELRPVYQLKTEAHGVVKGFHRQSKVEFEFALPRRETYMPRESYAHSDFESMAIAGLPFAEAVLRRDFTVNAMGVALHPDGAELWDPLHGLEDLQTKTLELCHPIDFAKDPVRFLRAHRFALKFDFTLGPKLQEALEHMDLSQLTAHYVGTEAEKSLRPFSFWNSLQANASLPAKFQGGLQAVNEMEEIYHRHRAEVGHSNALLAAVFATNEGWHLLLPLGGKGDSEVGLWRDRREILRHLGGKTPHEVLSDPAQLARACQLTRTPFRWPQESWVREFLATLKLLWVADRPMPDIDLRSFPPPERHLQKVRAWLA